MLSQKSEKPGDVVAIEDIQDEQDLKKGCPLESTLPISLQDKSAKELAVFRRKLVQKIDIRLMPMLILLFLLKYECRNSLVKF